MKLLLPFLVLFAFTSCKYDYPLPNDRTLQIRILDYDVPLVTDNYWAIQMFFDKEVTVRGTMTVSFDVWENGVYYKSYQQDVSFEIHNTNYFFKQTPYSSQLQNPAIKNIQVKNLIQETGNYNITITP